MSTYPWYDDATNGIRFNDLLATLNTLPARSIVLLHPLLSQPDRGGFNAFAMGCGD
ncbi:tyrosine aminotransferase, tyrosine repressible [Salmonella enterica subsp. enterica]|nr:tyrosine aminotransferase, tyrosine repressible [Salmonella enterica subsp. enterica]VEA26702.1 tyrosine aminotransferase, tyrosine repressible [Salmonella enterica subsp. enterica]